MALISNPGLTERVHECHGAVDDFCGLGGRDSEPLVARIDGDVAQ